MDKNEVIKTLEEISTMLELKDENPFKIRAYQNAARALEKCEVDISKNTDAGDLLKIKGIGQSLADYIKKLACDERLDFYEELKESITPELLEMLKIPFLGPKKVKLLFGNLNIGCISDLEQAILENRLVDLPGFGKKTQENILLGINSIKKFRELYLFSDVISLAESIVNKLKSVDNINHVSIAGSLRRKKETVKDMDFVAGIAEGTDPMDIMNCFTCLEEADEIISKGATKSTIRLKCGINADLRIVEDSSYPYLLHHFTGSREHNTVLRGIAKDSGIKINEYGIFKVNKLIKCLNEEEIYRLFKMDFIEPELRENNGEFEASLKGILPVLVREKDLKGIFHIHTTSSDGNITLKDLCEKLVSLNFEYAGVSDHSRSAFYAGGIKEEKVSEYLQEINDFCSRDKRIKIFKGIESDILSDGNLDYSNKTLEKFDFIIAAVHSNFNLTEEEMTNRIIKAIENRYTTILAHPTGRLLLSREPYKVDMTRIINAAGINSVAIEINSSPYRLDLDWRLCKYAKEKKVKIFINPDAHKIEDVDNYIYGVNTARKGWLEREDISNYLKKDDMDFFLKDLKNKKSIKP
ncbi:MAG: DNA polymerase/3'-5' exonuclease PolX [Candidatus Humimicrobiaceae bacterium]